MDPYDITEAIADIEDELIASIIRNMKRHHLEEITEKKQWSMWQAMQLEALERYKKENQKKFRKQFKDINSKIDVLIREANAKGYMDQEIEILEAIKNGFEDFQQASDTLQAEFFKMNDRKLEALINATLNDMKKAETAILRMANDKYRQVIYTAQVYANTGSGTYEQAVDMATKDFVSAGLNCVEYANGARHTLKDYARMAIRTASKRAYLQGEGTKRQEWGISTVIVNKRGNPCPKCLPFCGKVLIDDVWSGGSKKDGPYPLMSTAVAAGLYHPNCKDSHTTYFKGISTADDRWTQKELEAIGEDYRKEQHQQYAERQVEKYGRLAKSALDKENQKRYAAKSKNWEQIYLKLEDTTDEWSKKSREELYLDEKSLSIRTKETAVIYDSKGKYLFTKRGNEKSVEFTLSETRKIRNCIVTHNHPSGNSFSVADWMLFYIAELQELRAIGDNKVYYLRRKKKRRLNFSREEFENEVKEIRKNVRRKYHKMYEDGIITKRESFLLSSDEYNQKVADKFGFEYGKESI